MTLRRGTKAGVWQGEHGRYGESHRPAWGLLSHHSRLGNGEVRVVSDRPSQGWKNPLISGAWEGVGSAGSRSGHLHSNSPRPVLSQLGSIWSTEARLTF